MSHEDTIGTINFAGRTFEIDWLHDSEDPTKRDPTIAVVYLDGDQIEDICAPMFESFTTEADVMKAAFEAMPGIVAALEEA